MIVTCPHCLKRYMLDDALLPKEGRQVRCVACHHIWRQAPEAPPFINSSPFMGIGDVALDASLSAKKQFSWLRWVVFLGIIISLFSFLIFGRNFMVIYWPKTERLYDLFGLHVIPPGAGLSISNAISLVRQDGGVDMVQVAGDIINTSDCARSIPPLKIKFMGELSHPKCLKNHPGKGCVLDYWEHRLSESSLLPGEHIHFETTSRPKIEGTQHISVEF